MPELPPMAPIAEGPPLVLPPRPYYTGPTAPTAAPIGGMPEVPVVFEAPPPVPPRPAKPKAWQMTDQQLAEAVRRAGAAAPAAKPPGLVVARAGVAKPAPTRRTATSVTSTASRYHDIDWAEREREVEAAYWAAQAERLAAKRAVAEKAQLAKENRVVPYVAPPPAPSQQPVFANISSDAAMQAARRPVSSNWDHVPPEDPSERCPRSVVITKTY